MKLVDSAILRADGDTMARQYNGRLYVAQGAYQNRDEAGEFAHSFRQDGMLARVTQERKPGKLRMHSSKKYMWVVWACPPESTQHASEVQSEGVAQCP